MLNNDFFRRQNLEKLRGGNSTSSEDVSNQLRNLNNNRFNSQPSFNNNENVEEDNVQNNTDTPAAAPDTLPPESSLPEDEEKDSY